MLERSSVDRPWGAGSSLGVTRSRKGNLRSGTSIFGLRSLISSSTRDDHQRPPSFPRTHVRQVSSVSDAFTANESTTTTTTTTTTSSRANTRDSSERWASIDLHDVSGGSWRDSHPDPLCSNPPTRDESLVDEDISPTPPLVSFAEDVRASLKAIGGGSMASLAQLCRVQEVEIPPVRTAKRLVPATAHQPKRPVSPNIDMAVLESLQEQLEKLRVEKTSLNMLEPPGNEPAISKYEEMIAQQKAAIAAKEAAITLQEMTISNLRRQLQFKESEQTPRGDSLCAEMPALKGDWAVMGRAGELEHSRAQNKLKVRLDQRRPAPSPAIMLHSVDSKALESGEREVASPVESGVVSSDSASDSDACSGLLGSGISLLDSPTSSSGDVQTPATLFSSPLIASDCDRISVRGLYAPTVTPTRSRRASSSNLATPTPISHGGALSASTPRPFKQRPSIMVPGVTTSPAVQDQLRLISAKLAAHHDQYIRRDQPPNPQSPRPETHKTELEKELAAAREKQYFAEERTRELEAKVASQETIIKTLSTASSSLPLSPTAILSIPDLPVLTYTKPGPVWHDRVTSLFEYLNLTDLIEKDTPSPDPSKCSAADLATWSARRLHAIILLKNAINDDILEDVLYLNGGRKPLGQLLSASNSIIDNPRRLLHTILALRRAVPTSSADLAWLDRITDQDYDGIEGYTSLVLCLDKRHSMLYGLSADHYDSLLPRIQENMARRFPDLGRPLALDPPGMWPRRRWHMSVWMAKVVKKRQVKGAGQLVKT